MLIQSFPYTNSSQSHNMHSRLQHLLIKFLNIKSTIQFYAYHAKNTWYTLINAWFILLNQDS